MEKKRKRIQSSGVSKSAALVSTLEAHKKVKTVLDQQEKEQIYLNKPHMLFKQY